MDKLQQLKELKDLLPQLEEMKEEIISSYEIEDRMKEYLDYFNRYDEQEKLDKEILSKFKENADDYTYWTSDKHTPWAVISTDLERLISEKIIDLYTDVGKNYAQGKAEAFINLYKQVVSLFEEKCISEAVS